MTDPGAARITVRGTFVDEFGLPLMKKSVIFTPSFSKAAVELVDKLIIASALREVKTDSAGQFSVPLWATDDNRISPIGWTYTVTEPTGRSYDIPVPMDTPGGVLDLADVVPVGAPNPGAALLLEGPEGPRGFRGYGIDGATVDSDGHLVLSLNDSANTALDAGPLPAASSTPLLAHTVTAATGVSGHRVVTPGPDGSVSYASNTTPAHLTAPLWVTTAAAASGSPVLVVAAGPVVEPSWSWSPGPVWLGVDGLLTQTPPAAPALFTAQVGVATTPTTVFVDRAPSIALVA